MAALFPLGIVLTLAGLAGLGWCIRQAAKTKAMEEEAAKARLQVLIAWNLGSVALAGLGLMLVIVGLILT